MDEEERLRNALAAIDQQIVNWRQQGVTEAQLLASGIWRMRDDAQTALNRFLSGETGVPQVGTVSGAQATAPAFLSSPYAVLPGAENIGEQVPPSLRPKVGGAMAVPAIYKARLRPWALWRDLRGWD